MFRVRHVQIASACDPLVRPFHTQGAYEAFTGLLVGEDLDHIGTSFDLSIEPFQTVGGTDAFAMFLGKVETGQAMRYIAVEFVHEFEQDIFAFIH